MASRIIPRQSGERSSTAWRTPSWASGRKWKAASLDLGDQIVAGWVPLLGVTYDAQDDLLDVALSGLNHLIRRPREIYVREGPKGVETVAVLSADGVKQILHLKDPLMLPAAERPAR